MVTVMDKDGFKRQYKDAETVEERSGHLHLYRKELDAKGLRQEVGGFAPGQWVRWFKGDETTVEESGPLVR